MKLRTVFTALLIWAIARVKGQSYKNATFVASEIAQISSCGITCLEYTIPAAGCSFVNTTCQCASQELIDTTSNCMLANCSLAETLELAKIQAAVCDRPYESRNDLIRTTTIVCTVIGNIAVLLRLASRFYLNHSLALDDWFIIAAAISEALFAYFGVQIEHNGFGEHVWNINLAVVPQLFFWFYICEILYLTTIGLVKISILLFYLRVFPLRSLHLASWTMIAYCVATTLAFLLVTIFQCHPIAYIWNKDIKGGTCVNYNAAAWANAAINIQQDLLIIFLPVNALQRLQLNLRKKIGMYAMFSVGGFVCITSMIRLDSLRTFGLTADPTWDNVPTTFWSTLETTTAIFCACMPAIRAGLFRLFPKVMGKEATRIPHGGSFTPGTAYVRKVPSPDFANTPLKREIMSSSSMAAYEDEGRGSESELVAVISKFNLNVVVAAGKPDMTHIHRHTNSVDILKPLPSLPSIPDRAHSYG